MRVNRAQKWKGSGYPTAAATSFPLQDDAQCAAGILGVPPEEMGLLMFDVANGNDHAQKYTSLRFDRLCSLFRNMS